MTPHTDTTTEIFAIWEYDTQERYIEIEGNIRADTGHIQRINTWYENHGGRDYISKNYIAEVKNEQVISTLT